MRALQAHALLEGRAAVEEDDLAILAHVLWSQPEQRADPALATLLAAGEFNFHGTMREMRERQH